MRSMTFRLTYIYSHHFRIKDKNIVVEHLINNRTKMDNVISEIGFCGAAGFARGLTLTCHWAAVIN